MSYGGQVGYGNESWGKVFIDILMIHREGSHNYFIIYEPGFRRLYWQLGLGNTYYQYIRTDGLGVRVCLGYNYALGKYIMIRPALELNLGFHKWLSNLSINLNFGFKTPNLW